MWQTKGKIFLTRRLRFSSLALIFYQAIEGSRNHHMLSVWEREGVYDEWTRKKGLMART